MRRSIAEFLPGSVVKFDYEPCNALRCVLRNVCFLGDVLAEQAIDVLVNPSFPRCVGMGEVDVDGELFFEGIEPGEFFAIIDSKRMAQRIGNDVEALDGRTIKRRRGTVCHFARDEEQALTLDKRRHIGFFRTAPDRIGFPIPKPLLCFNDSGPFINERTPYDSAAPVGRSVPFAFFLTAVPEARIEHPSAGFVQPYMTINRYWSNAHRWSAAGAAVGRTQEAAPRRDHDKNSMTPSFKSVEIIIKKEN